MLPTHASANFYAGSLLKLVVSIFGCNWVLCSYSQRVYPFVEFESLQLHECMAGSTPPCEVFDLHRLPSQHV